MSSPEKPLEFTESCSLPDDLLVSFLVRISRLYYRTLSLVSKSFESIIASPKLYETRSSTNMSSLPDDVLVSFLVRISRLYYPTLSLVSKSFESIIASPKLYETRSSLGCTENCLYVFLWVSPGRYCRWFTLCLKPDKAITDDDSVNSKKSSGYVLAATPSPLSPIALMSSLVAVGSNIYSFGRSIERDFWPSSSSVSIMDCMTNMWSQAPSMQVERKDLVSNVLDGKIYVVGGSKECNSSNWMEVFDPKTQDWEFVPGPDAETLDFINLDKSLVIDGKLYMMGNRDGFAYNPKKGKWKKVGKEMALPLAWFSYCVIENVLYSYWEGEIKWYDTEVKSWKKLRGLERGEPTFARYCFRLVDYGGKMAILWEENLPSSGYKEKIIMCAVIALERRNILDFWGKIRPNSLEIWGKIEWQEAVLTVPVSYFLNYALTVTI